jgi:hypothetical protein
MRRISNEAVTEDSGVASVLLRLFILMAAIAVASAGKAATPHQFPGAVGVDGLDGPHSIPMRGGLRLASSKAPVDERDPQALMIDPRVSSVEDVVPLTEPMADPISTNPPEEVLPPEALAPDAGAMHGDPAGWDADYWQQCHEPPAPTCHSGTWFNRGRWYARQDFVYMSRYSMDTRSLVGDFTDVNPETGVPLEIMTTGRSLGFEPGGRLTLGHFLCRDRRNRDHSVEFVFFGLFDWQQSNGMTSRDENQLFTLIDPFRNVAPVGAFNFAEEETFTYDSSFDSYELNYVIAQRLGRDRLEMTPEGEWVRKLTPSHISTFLAGVRVIEIGEGFNWLSEAADPTEANGHYQVTTQNQMLGLHFGHEFVIQRPKFRFGIRNKVGGFINYADQDSFVRIVDNRFDPDIDQTRIESGSAHDMAFIYDLSIMAAYHLRPNLAIRTGYDFMFVNQLALAPEQLTFVPPPNSRIVTGGALLFNGFSIGVEMVW